MQESERGQQNWAVMIPVMAGLMLWFLLGFFNRFAGLRSGDGEYGGGVALLSGIMPYRDYFTAGPPLSVLKSALLLKTFGSALIVSRAAGVAERLLIGLVLLRWLVRLFRPWHALAATVVTGIVSTGDLTDPIASYNHDAILFAMISGLAASLALDSESEWRTGWLAAASGASAALSFLTKQTIGLGALACMLVAGTILLAKLVGSRRAGIWFAAFAAGCAVPIAAVAVWLWRMHVLRTCLQMMFVTGPAAKAGHATDFLVRMAMVAADNPLWVLPALIGLALSCRAILRGLRAEDTKPASEREQVAWIAAGIAIIGLAKALAYTSIPALHDFSKCAVYFTWIGLTIWLPVQAVWLSRAGITRRRAQVILLGAASWSIAAMLALSWPAFEAMTLPGLGFLLAAVLDGVRSRFRWFPLLMMALLVFFEVREKLDRPFGFGHQNEPAVRYAVAASVQPQLRGMRLPPETVRFLDDTINTVRTQSRPDGTIFTYPEMGLLYPLSGRRTPTWTGSHNIDVVNDAFAREEAERLRRSPPAVIVYSRLSEQWLEDDERMWRGGRRSGQRDMIAVIEELVKGYRLAGTYVIAPGDPEIDVYVRP